MVDDTIDDAEYCSVIQANTIILLGSLTFVNILHMYTLLKSWTCYEFVERLN